MKVMLDDGAFMPVRAHDTDAGLDLRTPRGFVLHGTDYADGDIQSAIIDTGVHIELPHGYYGKIESKSGLNVKSNIVSLGGTIDEGYTGSIVVKIYNLGAYDYTFAAGEKVAQLIIQPYISPEIEIVDALDESDRGDAGFGSTGR